MWVILKEKELYCLEVKCYLDIELYTLNMNEVNTYANLLIQWVAVNYNYVPSQICDRLFNNMFLCGQIVYIS